MVLVRLWNRWSSVLYVFKALTILFWRIWKSYGRIYVLHYWDDFIRESYL